MKMINGTELTARDEIERAIANIKRTAEDKWWRREWYKAAVRWRRQALAQRHNIGPAIKSVRG